MIAYVLDAQSRWIAIVRGPAVLMLPRATEGVTDLWEALATPDPIGSVLSRLTRAGIADVPPFAMIAGTDRRRVIVRGGFRVVADGEEITAAGVSTWVERVVAADGVFEVIAPFASTDDATDWPVADAVVPASIVRSGVAPTVESAPASAPAEDAPTHAAPTPPAPAVAAPAAAAASATPAPPSPAPEAALPGAATVTAETTIVPEETMAPPREDAVDDSVDDETIVVARRSAARSTSPSPRPGPPSAAPTDSTATGDHDGLTIAVTKLQRLRGRGASAPAASSDEASAAGASATETPTDAPTVTLRLPGGGRELLTGEIVLGRSPSVSRASGTALPRLVTIGAGDPDISRSHVRIGLEGGTVVVTDLHSRNGTTVVQPGRAPVKLRAGEPTPILVGTVVDLGGGCEITVVAG